MSARPDRLLEPGLLPTTLWDPAAKVLRLPPMLADAYRTLIDRHGLHALASSRDSKNPPVGGLDKARTDQHFAQAFDGSAARAQLAVTDPMGQVARASNAFIQILSGNQICVTDAPCGAGATVFAFLATIAELRAHAVLPRMPLDVVLIGAEISAPARDYAAQMLSELATQLEEQAVFVSASILSWDVTDSISTTDLIKNITVASSSCRKLLIVVANFNAFLEKERKKKEAEPQLEELFRHASGGNNMAIWIEPAMNRAIGDGGLFSWLGKLIDSAWRRFVSRESDFETASVRFELPLKLGEIVRVGLAVMAIVLRRSE